MAEATLTELTAADWTDLVRWYAEVGVDCAIDEAPHDRLAEGALEVQRRGGSVRVAGEAKAPPPAEGVSANLPAPPLAAVPQKTARPPGNPAAAMPVDRAILSAREQAASAATLEELRGLLERFDGCGLKATATRLAFADGNPHSRIVLVGEAPGAEEDRQGLPFVGPAGQLLDRMLAAIGLDRTHVYIANVVPWRPPGNRTPTPQETAICEPFIRRQIELVGPDLLVCLGGPSTQTLLVRTSGIMSARGKWYDYSLDAAGLRKIKALATFHPAYLLRQPAQKRVAWRDLRLLKKAFDNLPAR